MQHSREKMRCSPGTRETPSFPCVTPAWVSRAVPGTAPHHRVNSFTPHRVKNPPLHIPTPAEYQRGWAKNQHPPSLGTNQAAVGCSGMEQAGLAPPETTHATGVRGARPASPSPGREPRGKATPARLGGTLSASAPPREGPLTMCWPRVMDRRVHDSLFLVTHGFAGLRQCHGKYFFNNSKGGEGVGSGKQKEKLRHIVL